MNRKGFIATSVFFLLLLLALVAVFCFGVLVGKAHAQDAACGTASWYDYESCRREGTSGRFTANGSRFDPEALTCASWDFAFGTRLRIINTRTGRAVIVTVNDRGPAKRLYRRGRIIDLSRAAFAQLAPLSRGVIKIRVERI